MEPKKLTIDELVSAVHQKMLDLNYCEGHLRHCRECWHILQKYAANKCELYLTTELGVDFLREYYGIEMYSRNLSDYKNLLRRSVLLLLEYHKTGNLYKRIPRRSHDFPQPYREFAEEYLNYLDKSFDLSSGTLRNHHRAIEKFLLFAVGHKVNDLEGVDIDLINQYLQTMAGCSKSYINANIRNLSRFFRYAYEQKQCRVDFSGKWPVVRVESYNGIPKTFTQEQIKKILASVDRGNDRGKRDYAILLLVTRYGLRVSDIRNLEFTNLDFTASRLRLIQQKTKKPIEHELLPDVGWALIDYIKNGRPETDCKKIFVLHKAPYGGFAQDNNLGQIIYRYALASGVTEQQGSCSMHMFRYSLASSMLAQEIPIEIVSDVLGHSNLDTTKIYTKIDLRQLQMCALEVPYEN